jgi:hypothetical protein
MTKNLRIDLRQELKYFVSAKNYHSALHWILHSSSYFYKEHPDRQVNSIYFDSHDYDAYKDNLAGIATRKNTLPLVRDTSFSCPRCFRAQIQTKPFVPKIGLQSGWY